MLRFELIPFHPIVYDPSCLSQPYVNYLNPRPHIRREQYIDSGHGPDVRIPHRGQVREAQTTLRYQLRRRTLHLLLR